MKSAAKQALKDMVAYRRENGASIFDENYDVWVVTPHMLYCKEQRDLNRKLGIRGVNLLGNTNGVPKSKKYDKH